MEQIRAAFGEIKEINDVYQLSNAAINELLEQIESSRVCTPIIGKFSAGKSALINTLLGYSRSILKEAITPETSVPTEILYHPQDAVRIVHLNNEAEITDIPSFRTLEYDAQHINFIQLQLKNEHLLANIPDVMVVDMPGFESGYEIHNRAIDRYLPQSLAYIIAFPADDMVLKSSMGSILKELNLHQMPICIVITKRDKVSEDILQQNLMKLKQDISRFIDRHDEITYCITSSSEGEVEELRRFLFTIQEQGQQLLDKKYHQYVINEADKTGAYLKALLNNNHLSLSELEEQEDALNKEMNALNKKIAEEQEQFSLQIPAIVREIQADVRNSLQEAESTLITMVLNKQEITEKVNLIVRESLTKSIQLRFLPKVQRYMKKLSESIEIDVLGDMGEFQIDAASISKKIVNGVIAGISLLIFGPLLTIIGGVIKHLFDKNVQSKKREEIKTEVKQKLNTEVFPNIINQVGANVEAELLKQIQQLNNNITEEIANQRIVLEKAMADLKAKRTEEKLAQEHLLAQAAQHLQRIEDMKHGL